MSIVAFAGDIRVEATNNGVTLSKRGESWGDPWSTPDDILHVKDVTALIQALQEVQREKYNSW